MTRPLRRITALVLAVTVPSTNTWALGGLQSVVGVNEPLQPIPARTSPLVFTGLRGPGSTLAARAALSEAAAVDTKEDAAKSGIQARTGASVVTDATAQACNLPIQPLLECVVDNGGGSYAAHFGYESSNPSAVTIAVGSSNKFTPTPQGRGQTTTFQPGRTLYYPNAAFQVPFNGSSLTWTVKGPDNQTRSVAASSSSTRCPAPAPPCGTQIFGPRQYDRTSGNPNEFTNTVTVPANVPGPYTLRIENGAADGTHRASSAEVRVNGVQVIGPSDLNQTLASLAKVVTLTLPTSTLYVKLQCSPGSYLRITICGALPTDTTAPQVAVVEPANGSLTNDRTPHVRVTYADAGSGVNLSTLKLFVDDVDRTTLFTKTATEAGGDLPDAQALSDGAHRVRAEIKDVAGNLGTAQSDFTVDATAPSIAIAQPADGTRLGTAQTNVTVTFADNRALDLSTFSAKLDGQTVTLAVTATGATGQLTNLTEGSRALVVTIRDQAGNQKSATANVQVDLAAPALAIVQPAAAALFNTANVAASITYSDSQGLDLATFKVTLDGIDKTSLFTRGATQATATLAGISDGSHNLAVEIRDLAGHLAQTSATFVVDTVAPTYQISVPASGTFLATTTPAFTIAYADDRSGVDAAQFVFKIDGVDRTSRLAVTPTGASGTLIAAEALGQGLHAVTLQVKDRAGNVAPVVAHNFTVDTLPPTLGIALPAADAYLGALPVAARVTYADGGSGLDLTSLRITVDGIDRTTLFTRASDQATGALGADLLSDGVHVLAATIRDRAGNTSPQAQRQFAIDTQPPLVTIVSPSDGSYEKSTPIEVRGTVADADPQVAVTCRRDTQTSSAVVTNGQYTCSVALAEGVNTVEVTATDRLNHSASASVGTTLDTQPPQVTVSDPIEGQLVTGQSIAVTGQVTDASPVTVTVGGVPTTVDGTTFVASGVSLSGGPDVSVLVVAEDAAGNRKEYTLHVRVDNQPPTISITSPSDAALVRGPLLDVHGTVTDDSPVVVEVNHVTATLTCGGVSGLIPLHLSASGVSHVTTGACTFTVQLPVSEGTQPIEAVATDGAGNHAQTSIQVTVDSVAPVITVTAPTITNASSIELAGTVVDTTPVTLTLDGQPITLVGESFATTLALPTEGTLTFHLHAVDAAGNAAEKDVSVLVDRTAPTLQVLQPDEGASVGSLPLLVRGLASDTAALTVTVNGQQATFTQGAWQVPLSTLGEGTQTLEIVARDAAGNETTVTRGVSVSLTRPAIAINAPQNGLLTSTATITVGGTVAGQSGSPVSVNGAAANVQWGCGVSQSCTGVFTANVALSEGNNTLVAFVRDGVNRTASDQVTVTRDSTPPTVDLSVPERLQHGQQGQAVASASDSSPVTSVVLTLQGQPLASFASPPYVASFGVPASASNGDVLVVEVVALDAAGNEGRATRSVRIVGGGVVVGQVLDDATGLPLAGAIVRLFSGNDMLATGASDERGRYSFDLQTDTALLRVDKDGWTSVQRQVAVQTGVGTVAVDARLVKLGEGVSVTVSGGTLESQLRIKSPALPPAGASSTASMIVAGGGRPAPRPAVGAAGVLAQRYAQLRSTSSADVTIEVPPAAVTTTTVFHLTSLSAQGLPGLLPLGWSPLLALELRTDGGAGTHEPLALTVTGLGAQPTALQLVEYRGALQGWVMSASGLSVTDGGVGATLPGLGVFALVTADAGDPAVAVPAVGAVLTGIPSVALPPAATAGSVVDPPVVPPSGETAIGSVTIVSPQALPSGTLVSAEVEESYQLSNGQTASEERRLEDLLLYRQPAPEGVSLGATLPITPSRQFEPTELQSGTVRVTVKSGREGVRGSTGGSDAVQIENGSVRLLVLAGALPQNTALDVEEVPVSDEVPQPPGVTALHEVDADFSGQTLGLSAELSVASTLAQATDTLAVAQVIRVLGVAKVQVVALATLVGGRIVSTPYPGLLGVRSGGRYVFYRLSAPFGFVGGSATAQANGGALRAVVSTTSLPFVSLAQADGRYAVAAGAGTNTLNAVVPGTALVGNGTADVQPGQTTPRDLQLVGTVTSAVVRPHDGSVSVPVSTQIQIELSVALRVESVTSAGVQLLKVDAGGALVPVDVRLVLSGTRKLLSLIPSAALEYDTTYRLVATGLVDAYGSAVLVPGTSFQTGTNVVPEYDLRQLVITIQDENGLVHVSVPAGTFPPGTRVLIINAGNGIVVSLTAGNDGSVSGEFPASVEDRLLVTIMDPFGHVVDFERSQYFDAATGLTTVGVGGGVIVGENDERVEMRIPEGALLHPARIKLSYVSEPLPGTQPTIWPDGHFGGALHLESPDKPTFKEPIQLVFPKPADAPVAEGTYFQVLRRMAAPNDITLYEDVTEAVYEPASPASRPGSPSLLRALGKRASAASSSPNAGEQRIVSLDGQMLGRWVDWSSVMSASGALMSLAACDAILWWSFLSLLPGDPLPGKIQGKVLRTNWGPGGVPPTYGPVEGAMVSGRDGPGQNATALEVSDGGTFARTGPSGVFTLTDPRYTGTPVYVTAEDLSVSPPQVGQAQTLEEGPVSTHGGNGGRHNLSTVTIALPAIEPPPPPPSVGVRLFKIVEEQRQEITSGLVPADTPLLIGLTPAAVPQGQAGYVVDSDGAEIQGSNTGLRVVADPLHQTSPTNPLGNTYVVQDDGRSDGLYVPGNAGAYTVRVKAHRATSAEPFYVTYTFRVVAAGGGVTNDPNNPPGIVSAATVPKANARGVPVSITPQVVFTEPVTQVPANVSLTTGGSAVGIRLLGVTPEGAVIPLTPTTKVTSVTVQPISALSYGTSYTLTITPGIEDLDVPPKNLQAAYSVSFTTFTPEEIPTDPTDNQQALVGFGVIGDRAYAAETLYPGGILGAMPYERGNLLTFDISDPTSPDLLSTTPLTPPIGPPSDLTVDKDHKLVAVSLGSLVTNAYDGDGNFVIWSSPGNVRLYSVENDIPTWAGAVSLTTGILDGFVQRVALEGSRLYAATWRKGLQIVDLAAITGDNFPSGGFANSEMVRKMGLNGEGWKTEEVVTIQVPDENDQPINMFDLDVAQVNYRGIVQPLIFSTGAKASAGLVVASPATVAVEKRLELPPLYWGTAIAVGTVNAKPIALVGGRALGKPGILVAVDLSPLAQDPAGDPFVLATLELPMPSDIIFTPDGNAIVATGGTAYIISVGSSLRVLGTIEGVGSRIALTDSNILMSTTASYTVGTNADLKGLHAAALDSVTLISNVTENPVILALDGKTIEKQVLRYRSIPKPDELRSSELQILWNDSIKQRVEAPLDDAGRGEITLPEGTPYPSEGTTVRAQLVVNANDPVRPRPQPKVLVGARFEIEPKIVLDPLVVGVDRVEVVAANRALIERLHKDPQAAAPRLRWEVPGLQLPGGASSTSAISTQTGLYRTEFLAWGQVGDSGKARLLQGSGNTAIAMSETGPLSLNAGLPSFFSGNIVVAPPPQSLNTPGIVPADGRTEVTLTVQGVTDGRGNVVEDGTAVSWSAEGEDGEILGAETSVLVGGAASVRYRAGVVPGDVTVRATLGTGDLAPDVMKVIKQAELQFAMQQIGDLVIATVSSAGGPPRDGTPAFWWTARGTVTGEEFVQAGLLRGSWDPIGVRDRPWAPLTRRIPLFVTVGNGRGDLLFDRETEALPLRIQLDHQRITLDRPGQRNGSNILDESGSPFPSQTTATVTGTPGQTVRLVLGSARFPAMEPVAAYPLDTVENGEAEDIYGGPAASVIGSVTVDDSDPAYQPGAYRFSGGDGLSVTQGPAVELTSNFGFVLWANFDGVAAGQKLIEKAGAYTLEVIAVDGEARLEFAAWSGGVRRRVVSHQVLTPGSWYHVAAQVKDGRLALTLGDDRLDLGDAIMSVDASAAPLLIASAFEGRLDEVAVYDFSQPATMVFADGSIDQDVTLDAQGTAQVDLIGGAAFASARGTALNDVRLQPSGAYPDRLRTVPMRQYRAPEPPDPRVLPETLDEWARGIFQRDAARCAEGLASGESEDFAGVGCDLSAGLIPGVGAYQGVRDFYVVSRHFAQGKRHIGDYIKGVFAVVVLVALAVPGARALKTILSRARLEVTGAAAEARLAREALKKVTRVVEEGASESESVAARVLGREGSDSEAKEAVLKLLGVCSGARAATSSGPVAAVNAATCGVPISAQAQDALDAIAKRLGDEIAQDAFVKAMGLVASTHGTRTAERMLTAVHEIQTVAERAGSYVPFKVTAEAFEGMGVFFEHALGGNRLKSIWEELTFAAYHGLPPAQADRVAQSLFSMLKQTDTKVFQVILAAPDPARKMALELMWHGFIARGAGTSRRLRSTQGFFHSVQRLSLETPETLSTIEALDSEFAGYFGRPDALLKRSASTQIRPATGQRLHIETKNINPDRLLEGRELGQLKDIVEAAQQRARGNGTGVNEAALEQELQSLVYSLRGPIREELKEQVRKEIRNVLPNDFKKFADRVQFEFLPFISGFPF